MPDDLMGDATVTHNAEPSGGMFQYRFMLSAWVHDHFDEGYVRVFSDIPL
jgi:hypothetical protein